MKRFGKRFRQEWFVPIGFFLTCIGSAGFVLMLNGQIRYLIPAILFGLGVGLMIGGRDNGIME